MVSLKEKSQNILTEKTTKLLPENIKAGIEIMGVVGTYIGSTQYILTAPLNSKDMYGFDITLRNSHIGEQITEMDNMQSGEAGKLYLNDLMSLTEANPEIKMTSNIEGVNLLDYGCIDYETPKQLSGSASSLGGNYFITDKEITTGSFSYSIIEWGGGDCDNVICYQYNNLYLYISMYGNYMNEIEHFKSNPPESCSIG